MHNRGNNNNKRDTENETRTKNRRLVKIEELFRRNVSTVSPQAKEEIACVHPPPTPLPAPSDVQVKGWATLQNYQRSRKAFSIDLSSVRFFVAIYLTCSFFLLLLILLALFSVQR